MPGRLGRLDQAGELVISASLPGAPRAPFPEAPPWWLNNSQTYLL